MKYIDGGVHKRYAKTQWHRWFAWYPVKVAVNDDNRKIKVWLDWVERKGTIKKVCHFDVPVIPVEIFIYEYREVNK